jgi:hypothetical protein
LLCAAGGVAAALAGCLGDTGGGSETEPGDGPPVVERSLPEAYSVETLTDEMRSGGPGKDGIPSVDDPSFAPADGAPDQLQPQDPVFGVERDGEAKAYAQYVLVHHEIVNDAIAGDPVAVTYCPLTGTAQGFERGDVEFGVSGQLINSNLVMYDRGTDSYWPQMLARGIKGPHVDDYLEEFQVVWTTWERWRDVYPDTAVLTEETGIARNYGRDPYGAYNPRDGYYASDGTLFPPLASSDEFDAKTVVIGARNGDGALAVPKRRLREETVAEGTVGGVPYVTVYDPSLDTGYVYRNPEDAAVSAASDGIAVAGESFTPDSLPLDRQIGYDAMWMAWYGYYPSTEVHR